MADPSSEKSCRTFRSLPISELLVFCLVSMSFALWEATIKHPAQLCRRDATGHTEWRHRISRSIRTQEDRPGSPPAAGCSSLQLILNLVSTNELRQDFWGTDPGAPQEVDEFRDVFWADLTNSPSRGAQVCGIGAPSGFVSKQILGHGQARPGGTPVSRQNALPFLTPIHVHEDSIQPAGTAVPLVIRVDTDLEEVMHGLVLIHVWSSRIAGSTGLPWQAFLLSTSTRDCYHTFPGEWVPVWTRPR